MKKVICVLLAMIMVLSFAACGKEKVEEPKYDASAKSEGVMSYAQYIASEEGSEVTIEAYVQAKQSWWNDSISVFLQDPDGGYFVYNMACSKEDAENLVQGTKIKVTGHKTEWEGQIRLADASFSFGEGTWIAEAVDVSDKLGTEEIKNFQNSFVSINNVTIEAAPRYKWDGSGIAGDDIYFDVSVGGAKYTFMVESRLCGKNTNVYKAVQELKKGETVNMEGFPYWYGDICPNITNVIKQETEEKK